MHKKDNNLILLYKNLLYYKRDNNNIISISRFVLTIILVKMKRLCVPLSAMLKDSLTMEEHIAVTSSPLADFKNCQSRFFGVGVTRL